MNKKNLKIDLQIITPEKVICEEKVYQVTLPVDGGVVTILPKHRSYIASLKPGEVIYKRNKGQGEDESLAIAGGFIEFHKNKLIILADEAERADEIDLEKAEEARKLAEKLKEKVINKDELEYARIAFALEKELVKIKVAKKSLLRKGF